LRPAIRRAVGLSHQLLAIGRRQLDNREEIQVFPFLNRIAHDLRLILRSDVQVDTHIQSELPSLWGGELGLEQAVMDLALNARDALSHSGGTITLAAQTEEITEVTPTMQKDMPPGQYLCISVTACDSDEDLAGLRMAGVRGILHKPVRADELAKAIGAVLADRPS